ncbi:4244_t:CDS:2 [Ambispora gerdemannii]|uniref:4244_t:CDS:1 n=1 Tax=Ambispora gerdemannii TaxID=144530 RepID=A0A9N8Z6Z0_9GLOM|nr:4244_t:CDS:2 [Ambispora gerdemannii]
MSQNEIIPPLDKEPIIVIPPRIKPRPAPKVTYGKKKVMQENDDSSTSMRVKTNKHAMDSNEQETENSQENRYLYPSPVAESKNQVKKQKFSRLNSPLSSLQSKNNIVSNITNVNNNTSRKAQQKRKNTENNGQQNITNFFIKPASSQQLAPSSAKVNERKKLLDSNSNIPKNYMENSRIEKQQYPLIPHFTKRILEDSSLKTPPTTPKKFDDFNSNSKFEQLFLELGQKNFGPITCSECKMSYSKGTEDDLVHDRYHRGVIGGIDYPGYKNEVVIQEFPDKCRVILFTYSRASTHEKRKIREILEVIKLELNSIEISEQKLYLCKIFLYITAKKKVVGCVVAEHISQAYRVIPDENAVSSESGVRDAGSAIFCSTKKIPAVCGISRIWVSRDYRRKGIATKILDLVRNKFIYGCNLKHGSIAFSQPTVDGKALATRYAGTSEFLVYTEN